MVEVSIDTASNVAGVALTDQGRLLAELTWHTRQNHSRELLPALELLLQRSGLSRSDISALFVCIGPGSYAGLRVGLSTAKSLAYALGLPIVGVGRLTADAQMMAADLGPRLVPLHAAGRAELAWAVYQAAGAEDAGIVEVQAPRLGSVRQFLDDLRPGDLVIGDPDASPQAAIGARQAMWSPSRPGRVTAVARLGWRRLRAGDIDSADSLVPLYLREPAIGPQPARP